MILLRLDHCVTVCVYVCIPALLSRLLSPSSSCGSMGDSLPGSQSTSPASLSPCPLSLVLCQSEQSWPPYLHRTHNPALFMMTVNWNLWWEVETSLAMFEAIKPGASNKMSVHLQLCLWHQILDISDAKSEHFQPCFSTRCRNISPCICGSKKTERETTGQYPAVLTATKTWSFLMGGQNILCCVFEADTWSFPNPNLSGFVPKP